MKLAPRFFASTAFIYLLAFSGFYIGTARAQVSEMDSESALNAGQWNSNTQIEAISSFGSSDLLLAGSPSFLSLEANNPANTSVIATSNSGLNDGLSIGSNADEDDYAASAYYAYNYGSQPKGSLITGDELGNGGEILTFDLNLTNSPAGYDIDSVNTIAGWTDHASVANQNFTLAYSLVSDPTSFITLTSVAYNPNDPTNDNPGGGGVATEVSLTNVDLSCVAALQFTFTPDPTSTGNANGDNTGTGLWLQEIDANGTETSPVPEPDTWALMVVGAAGAAVLSLRRRMVRA